MVGSPRGARGADQGFSLIELVVAMVVLGTMAMAVIGVIMNAQSQGVANRSRIAAANLAAREIDLVREEFAATKTGPVNLAAAGYVVNPHPLSGGTAGQPLTIDGREYTIVRTAQWNIAGTGASACEGGSLVAYPTLGVTVSVTWPDMGNVQPVVSTAALAPDKETGVDSTDSFIAAKVRDQNADPLTGIPVTATGGATTIGYTDASGCAVIRVSPAVAGTAYTITVADSSYVDLSGTPNPSKNSGVILQGQIYAGASFSVAKAASVTVKIVRSDGVPLTDAQASGSTVTLVASQFSGASGESPRIATGVLTTFANLWPTGYGAYFGNVPPTGGYDVHELPPGGHITIDVPLDMAAVLATGLPAGTTNVIAVPAGTPTTCTTGTSEPVSGAGASFLLMPAAYDFYAVGSTFACSPGPVNVALGGGENEDIVWATTTIRIQGLASGTVWIAEKQKSGLATLTTCPTTAPVGAIAVNIDGARTAPVAIPAGSWWVWQTSGPWNGTCVSYPDLISAFSAPYGTATSKTWGATPPPTLYSAITMTSVGTTNRWLLLSTATVSTCTSSTATTAGTRYQSGSKSSSTVQTLTIPGGVPRPVTGTTTYYAYLWNKETTGTGNRCTDAGTYVVGPATTTLSKSLGSSSVGP
ncbi:type II secretion system protein [uncultured Cellulomonas sp.]|uniref:type II secretion system protein n=1 Tax=uncultured Cellulomonas sp. TaxID=189682 RepID=UPI0028EB1B27|nr:type II secretion system protein [uncultured Cellulomonas sp.]